VPLDQPNKAPSDPLDGLLAGFMLGVLPNGRLFTTPESAQDQVFILCSGHLRVHLTGKKHEPTWRFLEAHDINTTHAPTFVELVTPTVLWVTETRPCPQDVQRSVGHAVD